MNAQRRAQDGARIDRKPRDGSTCLKRGPKRQDSLLSRLEEMRKGGSMSCLTEKERNRALKFARVTGRTFLTRTVNGQILLWRVK